MDPDQFDEWVAFFRLEPLGFEKLYHVLSLVGSAASGAFSGKPLPPHLFIPGAKEHEQSPEEQIAICSVIAAQHNARK